MLASPGQTHQRLGHPIPTAHDGGAEMDCEVRDAIEELADPEAHG